MGIRYRRIESSLCFWNPITEPRNSGIDKFQYLETQVPRHSETLGQKLPSMQKLGDQGPGHRSTTEGWAVIWKI